MRPLSSRVVLSCTPILTFDCCCRSTALGSALLAGSAIRLHGWDISKPETLAEVNTKGNLEFAPSMPEDAREKRWQGWKRAIQRSLGWEEGVDE